MGIHTSEITSASDDGNISINPNGSGKTILQKNSGKGEDIVGVDNSGAVKSFDANNLAVLPSNPTQGDAIVVQRGDVQYQVDATDFGTGGGGGGGGGGGTPGTINWAPTFTPTASPETVNYSGLNLYGQVEVTWSEASTLLSTQGNLRVKVGGGGTWGVGPTAVGVGNVVYLKWEDNAINAGADGDEITGTFISASGVSEDKSIVLKRTPSQMSFGSLTDVPLSSVATSASAVGDYNVPTAISLNASSTMTGVEISVGGGSFTALDSTGIIVSPGASIKVRGSVGSDTSASYSAVVNIGSGTYTFTASTIGLAPSVSQPTITSPFNGAVGVGSYTGGVSVVGTAYQANNSAGSHASSDWEVYANGFPLTSTNTITNVSAQDTQWTLQQTGSSAPSNAVGVAFDAENSLFMVIDRVNQGTTSEGFKPYTTTDFGQTWTEYNNFVTPHPTPAYAYGINFHGVGYNQNGTWIVMGTYINTGNNAPYAFVAQSTNNGASWNQQFYVNATDVPSRAGYNQEILWWNNQWRIASVDGISSSSDGFTWTSAGGPLTAGTVVSVTAGANGIIGWGNAGYHLFSPDGTNTTEFYDDQIGGCAAYGDGLWVAATRAAGNVSYIKTSTDGLSWTQRKTYQYSEISITDATCAYGNGQFIIQGTDSSGATGKYVTSFDGITWSSPSVTNIPSGRFVELQHTLGYQNSKRATTTLNKFYAISGNGAQTIFCSSDGASTILTINGAFSDGFKVGDVIDDCASADDGVISYIDNASVHLTGNLSGYVIGDNICRSSSSYQLVDQTTSTTELEARNLAPAPGGVVTPNLTSTNPITNVGTSTNNWQTIPVTGTTMEPSLGAVKVDYSEPDSVYIWQSNLSNLTRFKKSTDGGATFTDLSTVPYPLTQPGSWDVNGDVIIIAGDSNLNNGAVSTLKKSVDGGLTWTDIPWGALNVPEPNTPIVSNYVNYLGDNVWMIGFSNSGIGSASTDNGQTWAYIEAGSLPAPFGGPAAKTENRYVMTGRPSTTFPTAFSGATPTNLPNRATLTPDQQATTFPTSIAYSPVNGGTLIAAAVLDVWRSTNEGLGWQNIITPLQQLGNPNPNAYVTAIGDTFFLATDGPERPISFYYSQDGGTTWTEVDTGTYEMGEIVRTNAGTYIAFTGTEAGGISYLQTATIPFNGVGLTISGADADGFQVGDVIDDVVGGGRAEILAIDSTTVSLANGTTGFEVGEKIRRGGQLLSNTDYFARVRYRSDDPVVSNYSDFSKFTTGNIDAD